MWIQKVPGGGVRAMTYSPDGATLYTVDTSGWITAWDVAARAGRKVAHHAGLSYTSRRLHALADGKRITTDGRDRTVWDTATGRVVTGADPGPRLEWEPTCVRPDGRVFGFYFLRAVVGGWNLGANAPEPERAVLDTETPLRDFDLAPHEQTATVTNQNGTCSVYEWGSVLRNPVRVSKSWIAQARFSPDGATLVATLGNSWTVMLWDVKGRRPRVEQVPCVVDRRFAFNPVLPVFAAVNRSDMFAVWSIDTGEQLRALDFELGRRVRCACFSPDGLTCAVGGSNKQFAVFDVDV